MTDASLARLIAAADAYMAAVYLAHGPALEHLLEPERQALIAAIDAAEDDKGGNNEPLPHAQDHR